MRYTRGYAFLAFALLVARFAWATPNQWQQLQSGTMMLDTNGITSVAPALGTDVHIDVSGVIARVRVLQTFRNTATDWSEAVYVFPLPEDAAVDHMRLRIGERLIEGEIREKQLAEKMYRQAKREGRRASLLRQERPNLFTTRVANIPPGESVQVEIEYQQTVRHQESADDTIEYRLRFPLTVTPRYMPGAIVEDEVAGSGDVVSDGSEDARDVVESSSILFPVGRQGSNANPTRVIVDLRAGFDVAVLESVDHEVIKQMVEPGRYRIELSAATHMANADFRLRWQAAARSQSQASFFLESWQDELYGLLMLTPPASELAPASLPRDVIFILDTSGSMGGDPLRQASIALDRAIGALQADDRFDVIEFNSTWQQLWGELRPADSSHIRRAREFVRSLESSGGTEMAGPLQAAMCRDCTSPGRLRQIIFITDGAVGNEEQLFNTIRQGIGEGRLFTVGIGSAPNSYFMRKAAQAGRGTFTYIGATGQVDEAMAELFGKLQNPVLADIQLSIDGHPPEFMTPDPLPDLYQGEPLVVAMKLGGMPSSISLQGRMADNVVMTSVAVDGEERSGVHGMWARRRIEDLHDQYNSRSAGAAKAELRQLITDLGLAHHLVSPFTSLVAVDKTPVRPEAATLRRTDLPNNPPHKTRFGLAATATPAGLYFAIGTAMLSLGLLLLWLSGRKRTGLWRAA